MKTKERLIDANFVKRAVKEVMADSSSGDLVICDADQICNVIDHAPTVDAIVLPCKIGDTVWGIRCYRGVLVPQKGKVSEMLFTDDMKLSIVIKHICRGEWGKKVFATREEVEKAIAERRTDNG